MREPRCASSSCTLSRGPLGLARLHASRHASHHLRIRGRRLVGSSRGASGSIYTLWRWKLSRASTASSGLARPPNKRRNPRGRSGEPAPSGHHHDRNVVDRPTSRTTPTSCSRAGASRRHPSSSRTSHLLRKDEIVRARRHEAAYAPLHGVLPPHQRRRLLRLHWLAGWGTLTSILRGFNYSADAHARHARHPCGQRLP